MTEKTKSEYEYNPIKTSSDNEKREIPSNYGFGIRHYQLILLGISLTVIFVARGHMGVTIVAMVNDKIEQNLTFAENNTNVTDFIQNGNISVYEVEADINNTAENVAKEIMTYDWPKSTQEMILGAFFVGYFIMTFPMGLIAQRFGGIVPLQISLLVNSVVSFATPWLTSWGGWKAVCACRLLQGLSQAGTFPGVQNLLAKWVPTSERSSLSSYVYTGTTLGTVIAFQLAGFLAETRWGWPSTFWVVGSICLISFALLSAFGASSPTVHKSISEEEKNYILGRIDDGSKKRLPTPWKRILSSRKAWANFCTHIGSGATFVFYFVQVPTYIHCILGINVKSSGILSSLPYLAAIATSIAYGSINDYITNKGLLSLKNARRISNSFSQIGMALCLVCVSFTTSTLVAVTCLVVAMGCHTAIHTGWMVNHIDLAPNFTGTLMAIGNCMANSINVLCPILVSFVVTDVYNIVQWRIMFFIIAGLAFSTNIIFVIFLSTDLQPWNFKDEKDICLEDQVPALKSENKDR